MKKLAQLLSIALFAGAATLAFAQAPAAAPADKTCPCPTCECKSCACTKEECKCDSKCGDKCCAKKEGAKCHKDGKKDKAEGCKSCHKK